NNEIEKQFKEAEKCRSTYKNISNESDIHPQAIYTSRLLNPFTKDLEYIDDSTQCLEYIDNFSDCLDCLIEYKSGND
ncbi:hypothetical protein C1645_880873, partial [Glomus cerebriforme]